MLAVDVLISVVLVVDSGVVEGVTGVFVGVGSVALPSLRQGENNILSREIAFSS